METVAPILIGLLFVGGLGALFATRDVWRAYHITVAAFLMIASAVFVYLSARTLKTHDAYRTKVVAYDKAIAASEQQRSQLVEGSPQPDPADYKTYGIDRLNSELSKVLAGRGRVWDRGVANRFDPQTGVVSMTFENQAPKVEENTTVFAFDRRDPTQGGAYMGEFLVTAAGEKELQLTPVAPLLQWQAARIGQAAGPWILYENMPADNHETFASLTPDQLQAYLPAQTLPEFLKDGKPPEPNDPPERVWRQVKFLKDHSLKVDDVEATIPTGQTATVDPKTAQELVQAGVAEEVGQVYRRELRNYAQLFRELRRKIQVESDNVRDTTDQVARIRASWDALKQDIAYRQSEIEKLKIDKEKFEAERAAVEQLVKAIEKRQAEVRAELSATFQQNLALAQEIASLQKRAVQAVEQQLADAEPVGVN